MNDLAGLDERLEAHLAGLRLAGADAWGICREAFDWDDPGELFTGAILAFGGRREMQIAEFLEIADAAPKLQRGVVSALGWLPWEGAAPHLRMLLGSDNPLRRRIGIAGAAVHRVNLGSLLEKVLHDDDPGVRARALRAAGETGRVDLLNQCRQELLSEDEACRFWAAWTVFLLGDTSSMSVLRNFAEGDSPYAERAADMLVRRLSPDNASQWLQAMAANPDKVRMAIRLAGVYGAPALVPWLIQFMRQPEQARLAAESLRWITGVDIEQAGLTGVPPQGFESGPSDEGDDEDVAVDPEGDLPWPDAGKFTEWWLTNCCRLKKETRCLLGEDPITMQLIRVLLTESQVLRKSAAMEAALQRPERSLLNIAARAQFQQTTLSGTH